MAKELKSNLKKRRRYSPTSILKAVSDVEEGHLTIYAASKKYGVPRSTLHNKIQGFTPVICKIGPSSTLTDEEEFNLVKWLENVAEAGFPATKTDLLDRVQKLVKGRTTPFSNGRPGNRWFKSFLKRNPTIKIKLKNNRRGKVDSDDITTQEKEDLKNDMYVDEISSNNDDDDGDDMIEDSISYTDMIDTSKQNDTSFVECNKSIDFNENPKKKIPKYVVPGETEETKWLTTKQLERMALIEHINFSKIQREYYAEKIKLMKNK